METKQVQIRLTVKIIVEVCYLKLLLIIVNKLRSDTGYVQCCKFCKKQRLFLLFVFSPCFMSVHCLFYEANACTHSMCTNSVRVVLFCENTANLKNNFARKL